MLSADTFWEPIEGGVLVAVVGPSGAGKDTLIDYARQRLAGDSAILFVRRIVTRPALPSAEDHDSLPLDRFIAARAAGAFAVTWEAHGLHYAIPAETLRHVGAGGVAVVNGSRAALPAMESAFGRVLAISVVCRPEVLAARLASRGRETAAEQSLRVARGSLFAAGASAVEVVNSGDVATSGEAILSVIRDARLRCSRDRAALERVSGSEPDVSERASPTGQPER